MHTDSWYVICDYIHFDTYRYISIWHSPMPGHRFRPGPFPTPFQPKHSAPLLQRHADLRLDLSQHSWFCEGETLSIHFLGRLHCNIYSAIKCYHWRTGITSPGLWSAHAQWSIEEMYCKNCSAFSSIYEKQFWKTLTWMFECCPKIITYILYITRHTNTIKQPSIRPSVCPCMHTHTHNVHNIHNIHNSLKKTQRVMSTAYTSIHRPPSEHDSNFKLSSRV